MFIDNIRNITNKFDLFSIDVILRFHIVERGEWEIDINKSNHRTIFKFGKLYARRQCCSSVITTMKVNFIVGGHIVVNEAFVYIAW